MVLEAAEAQKLEIARLGRSVEKAESVAELKQLQVASLEVELSHVQAESQDSGFAAESKAMEKMQPHIAELEEKLKRYKVRRR